MSACNRRPGSWWSLTVFSLHTSSRGRRRKRKYIRELSETTSVSGLLLHRALRKHQRGTTSQSLRRCVGAVSAVCLLATKLILDLFFFNFSFSFSFICILFSLSLALGFARFRKRFVRSSSIALFPLTCGDGPVEFYFSLALSLYWLQAPNKNKDVPGFLDTFPAMMELSNLFIYIFFSRSSSSLDRLNHL